MKSLALAAALAGLCASPAWADPPPATAPPYRPGVSLQPVTLYDQSGNPVIPAGTSTSPAYTTPAALTAASATVVLPQGTATQLSVAGLKRFSLQVQGTGRVLVGFDNTVCSAGYRLDGAATATAQGTMQTWFPANAGAYWGCAPDTASSVFVERGQ